MFRTWCNSPDTQQTRRSGLESFCLNAKIPQDSWILSMSLPWLGISLSRGNRCVHLHTPHLCPATPSSNHYWWKIYFFKKEQRNKGSTNHTAKEHITILHSRSRFNHFFLSFESKAIYLSLLFVHLFCTKNDQWSAKPSRIKCTMPTWSRKNQVMITKSNFSASASLVVFLIFLRFPVVLDPERHAYNEQFWLRWHLLRKQSWWFPSWFPHSPVSVLGFSFVFHAKGKEQSREIC